MQRIEDQDKQICLNYLAKILTEWEKLGFRSKIKWETSGPLSDSKTTEILIQAHSIDNLSAWYVIIHLTDLLDQAKNVNLIMIKKLMEKHTKEFKELIKSKKRNTKPRKATHKGL